MSETRRQFEPTRAAAVATLGRLYADLLAARDATYVDGGGPDDRQTADLLAAICHVQSARNHLRSTGWPS
jgi:hypothetical protein